MFTNNRSSDISVYTDGSCINNQNSAKRRAGWAAYYEDDEFRHHSLYGMLPGRAQTNNRAELWAILTAIKVAIKNKIPNSGQHLVIHTDSEYSIDIITGRKRAKSNKDILIQLKEAIKSAKHWFIIDFEHVRAHVGIPSNELVDKYAKMGAILVDDTPLPIFDDSAATCETPVNTPIVKPVNHNTNLEAYFNKAIDITTKPKKKKQKIFKEFVPASAKLTPIVTSSGSGGSGSEEEKYHSYYPDESECQSYQPSSPTCMNCFHMGETVAERVASEFREIMSQYNLPRKTVHSDETLEGFQHPTVSTSRDGNSFDELNGKTIGDGMSYYVLWSSGIVDKVTVTTRAVYDDDMASQQMNCGLVSSFTVGYNGVNIPVRIRDVAKQIKMKKV